MNLAVLLKNKTYIVGCVISKASDFLESQYWEESGNLSLEARGQQGSLDFRQATSDSAELKSCQVGFCWI